MFLLRLIKWLWSLFFPGLVGKKQAGLQQRCACLLDERTIRRIFPGLKIRKQGDGKWRVRTQDSLIPYLFFCAMAPAGRSSTKYTATRVITSTPLAGRGYALKLIEYLDPQGARMPPRGANEQRNARLYLVSAGQERCLVDFYKPNA